MESKVFSIHAIQTCGWVAVWSCLFWASTLDGGYSSDLLVPIEQTEVGWSSEPVWILWRWQNASYKRRPFQWGSCWQSNFKISFPWKRTYEFLAVFVASTALLFMVLIFWDLTLCSGFDIFVRFEWTWSFQLPWLWIEFHKPGIWRHLFLSKGLNLPSPLQRGTWQKTRILRMYLALYVQEIIGFRC